LVGTSALMGRKNSCEIPYSNGWNILSKQPLFVPQRLLCSMFFR
jgi:hypothetical protein